MRSQVVPLLVMALATNDNFLGRSGPILWLRPKSGNGSDNHDVSDRKRILRHATERSGSEERPTRSHVIVELRINPTLRLVNRDRHPPVHRRPPGQRKQCDALLKSGIRPGQSFGQARILDRSAGIISLSTGQSISKLDPLETWFLSGTRFHARAVIRFGTAINSAAQSI